MIEGDGVPLIAKFPVDDPGAAIAVLRRARAMLAKGGWVGPRSTARDARGNECPVNSVRATTFAAGSAIVRARLELDLDNWAAIYAQRLLARATLADPATFNRACRHAREVVEAFDRAIRIGEKILGEENGKAKAAG